MARCFVAMAFGKADADAVFEKFISPAVRKCCGTVARRVDRIEHNDDIDDRIIAELDAADFVIADLTYARPSVYFEAGYAQRKIPVIYTARRDHFREDAANDPNGNLRVHFDLKMKNIVDWKNQDDRAFERRLERRISHVLKPILARRKTNAARTEAITSFGRLPLTSRLSKVQTTALEAVEGLGFTGSKHESGARFPNLVRIRKQTLEALHIRSVDAIRIDDLRKIVREYSRPWYDLNAGGLRPQRISEVIVVCSLGRFNYRIAAQVLREYGFDEVCSTFSLDMFYGLPARSFFVPGASVKYVKNIGSSEFRISRPNVGTQHLSFYDGYWGTYGLDAKGKHRFLRHCREATVPVRRTFVFVDQVLEIETLAERVVAATSPALSSHAARRAIRP